MKNFNNYNLEDFLLDDEFRFGVWENENGNHEIWNKITSLCPEKISLMYQARELILVWGHRVPTLTKEEIANGLAKILVECEDEKTGLNIYKRLGWLSIAASVIVVLGVGFAVMFKSKTSSPENVYKEAISNISFPLTEVINNTDKQKIVNLPDGSTVQLAPLSRISYAIPFIQNKKREIYLAGEAFFDIHKDVSNPLFVYANGLMTRVVGTSFLIKTSENDVKVLVRTGRVSVVPIKDVESQTERKTELLLTPNQLALFNTKDNIVSKALSPAPLQLSDIGTEPAFFFENQPIGQVFTTLEKVYGIPIVYDSTVMAKCSLHVELSDEPFFTKLDIITKTIRANYRISDGQVIISGKGCKN